MKYIKLKGGIIDYKVKPSHLIKKNGW